MKTPGKTSRIFGRSSSLHRLVEEFHDAHQAHDLLEEFLRHRSYSQSFCRNLFGVAKGATEAAWETRRLAILMLEHQILKINPDDLDAFDFLLTQLHLRRTNGSSQEITSSVLREGFSTTQLRPFISEFRNKLQRLNRVHDKILGRRTSLRALKEFILASRSDCKLALARYLFRPDEVVDEILSQLRVSNGVRDVEPGQPRYVKAELKCAMEALPDFEAGILKRLSETSAVYWVSAATGSEINSLVEYPLTTVVLVIKLPGSDIEFEIKRAGRRGHHSLNVVYAHDGYTVPPSHRLDGGSMQWLLRYEANNGSKLATIYRLVHGTQAPMGSYISRSTIHSIPAGTSNAQTFPYFTEAKMFGEGFRGMRIAMKESVAAFRSEGNANIPAMLGDWGLTAQFIGQVAPGQAIISGTSSFRLDKLATYLSANGPDCYFKKGLNTSYTKHDAKVFTGAILEEVLGCYQPPRDSYQSTDQYLRAVLYVKENRERADRIYLSLIRQIAKFWGTVLAVRGYSRGESFVARNVGVRSFWNDGQWDVKIIFMDHDALVIPNSSSGRFFAHGDVPNMTLDERYIWGRSTPERFAASLVGCLHRIYQVGPDLDEEGEALGRIELKTAYKKTQHEMLTNPDLQRLFSKGVVERLLDWDTLVGGYLQMNGNKAAAGKWKNKMKKMLAAKGYRQDMFGAYLAIMEKNRPFLSRYESLFESNTGKPAKLGLN